MKKKLILLILIGFMIPPVFWLFLDYYSNLLTFKEILTLITSLPMILYVLIVTFGWLFFFNKKFTVIEKALVTENFSDKVHKTISQ